MSGFRALIDRRYLPTFLLWRARREKGNLEVSLQDGTRLFIRGGTTDYFTAMEIFSHHQYVFSQTDSLRDATTVIDLGANVGFSLLYFAHLCPKARIIAFEPHPDHAAQVRKHIEANGLAGRVTLHEAAAGTERSQMHLSNQGAGSAVIASGGEGTLAIPVLDFFAEAPSGPIDLLKIDIEGSEYGIFADPRFVALSQRIRCIALEWHHCYVLENGKATDGQQWVTQRLKSLGYTVENGHTEYGIAGMLFACRTTR